MGSPWPPSLRNHAQIEGDWYTSTVVMEKVGGVYLVHKHGTDQGTWVVHWDEGRDEFYCEGCEKIAPPTVKDLGLLIHAHTRDTEAAM